MMVGAERVDQPRNRIAPPHSGWTAAERERRTGRLIRVVPRENLALVPLDESFLLHSAPPPAKVGDPAPLKCAPR